MTIRLIDFDDIEQNSFVATQQFDAPILQTMYLDSLRTELNNRADEVFEKMREFDPPSVRLVEKNISPKNVEVPGSWIG